jgi:hypothetical protein
MLQDSGMPERLSWWKCKAATPATWAEATEVPDLVAVAERDGLLSASTCSLDTTDVPGARISTQLPTLEKVERESEWSVEPTVIWDEWKDSEFLTLPGEKSHDSEFLSVPWFPAGATTSRPDDAALEMAASTAG